MAYSAFCLHKKYSMISIGSAWRRSLLSNHIEYLERKIASVNPGERILPHFTREKKENFSSHKTMPFCDRALLFRLLMPI
jgi:hypothetical protein